MVAHGNIAIALCGTAGSVWTEHTTPKHWQSQCRQTNRGPTGFGLLRCELLPTMHGYVSEQEFIDQIAGFLGWYYLAASLMNAIAAGWSLRASNRTTGSRQCGRSSSFRRSVLSAFWCWVAWSSPDTHPCFRCRADCATPPIAPSVRW